MLVLVLVRGLALAPTLALTLALALDLALALALAIALAIALDITHARDLVTVQIRALILALDNAIAIIRVLGVVWLPCVFLLLWWHFFLVMLL